MRKVLEFLVRCEVDWPLNDPPDPAVVQGVIQDSIDQSRDGVDDGIHNIEVLRTESEIEDS